VLLVACLVSSGSLRADTGAAAAESLVLALAAADPDPVALCRVVARHGDAAVLALLKPGAAVAPQLLALRAAPCLEARWDALPSLPPLLRSRDSELAPAAAASLTATVAALDAAELDRHEVQRAALCRVGPALRAAANDGAVRPDVRQAAGVAAHLLDGLCGAGGAAGDGGVGS
jgi:hypothetical protein